MEKKLVTVFLVLIYCASCLTQFTFPDVKLEAFTPNGFRVQIPEIEGIRLFAFHGNRNRPISSIEPGEFTTDIINLKQANWTYFEPDLKFEIGDKIHYWMFIQYENWGYRKDAQIFEVKELLPLKMLNRTCDVSQTTVLGRFKLCKGATIMESYFNSSIANNTLWKFEHYIPGSPDYEFCSYQNSDEVRFTKLNSLFIKPKALQEDSDVRGTLNLRDGCTQSTADECYFQQHGVFILPPVISAKVKSVVQFKYGKVDIKAQLPKGDWLYPEIYLQSVTNPNKKLWIAYSRGNKHLLPTSNEFLEYGITVLRRSVDEIEDLGGYLLFGGPVFNPEEPTRSKFLSSKRGNNLFSSSFHTYSVTWTPDKIELFIDGELFGQSNKNATNQFQDPVQVVLGVGVGGVNDFPDNYESTNRIKKPWKNNGRTQVKTFFNDRNNWLSTWQNDDYALKVKYVKIWAL